MPDLSSLTLSFKLVDLKKILSSEVAAFSLQLSKMRLREFGDFLHEDKNSH